MDLVSIDESNIDLIEDIRKFDAEDISSYTKDPFTFEKVAVLDDNGKPIALGILRVVEEYKIILDPKLSNRQKTIIIRELMTESRYRNRCNEVIVFITQGGEHYKNFLKKHFGFRERDGIALMKEV